MLIVDGHNIDGRVVRRVKIRQIFKKEGQEKNDGVFGSEFDLKRRIF